MSDVALRVREFGFVEGYSPGVLQEANAIWMGSSLRDDPAHVANVESLFFKWNMMDHALRLSNSMRMFTY